MIDSLNMKIVLVGYGAMGKMVERLAAERGHQIAGVIDESCASLSAVELPDKLRGADVAIDFSTANAVERNVEACVTSGVPLVEGTTGWQAQRSEIERIVREGNGAFVFGANFSIGVNLFYRIAGFAAELFAQFPEYEAFIEERHHSRKKDAPSGTALKLEEVVSAALSKPQNADDGVRVPISSTRAGNIPGTHTVGFDGPADQITLTHTARTREGFAHGAILAAEWIVGKEGCFEFSEIINEVLMPKKA